MLRFRFDDIDHLNLGCFLRWCAIGLLLFGFGLGMGFAAMLPRIVASQFFLAQRVKEENARLEFVSEKLLGDNARLEMKAMEIARRCGVKLPVGGEDQ